MIRIDVLSERKQFVEAVRLQKEIWEFEDVDLLPVRLFVVAGKIGGQVYGAYDGDRMVGFALAIPGIKQGYGAYLHSHMVGVAADYRNKGVGRLLKLRQREDALARGVRLMEWTFDPLELKNARFNIERLGAIVRRYVHNQYGRTSSALHGGLPTDRCTAEWWMESDRVRAAVAGEGFERGAILRRIAVPIDVADIRARDPKLARKIQAEASEQFIESFANGLAVTGFALTETAGEYLLGRWQ